MSHLPSFIEDGTCVVSSETGILESKIFPPAAGLAPGWEGFEMFGVAYQRRCNAYYIYINMLKYNIYIYVPLRSKDVQRIPFPRTQTLHI